MIASRAIKLVINHDERGAWRWYLFAGPLCIAVSLRTFGLAKIARREGDAMLRRRRLEASQ